MPATSHDDEASRLVALAQFCIDQRKQLGLPDEDARSIVFNNVFGCAEGTIAMLNLLHRWGTSPGREVIPPLLGMTSVDKAGVDRVGKSVHGLAKRGFMLLAQSQIENGLRNIARGLGTIDPALSYYHLAAAIVRTSGVPVDRHNKLRVTAELRNSLHDNGIFHGHHGNDLIATVNGVSFEFRHEQRVQCASLSHLALAFSAALETFGEICRTPPVSAIPAPLMDRYSWDKLTSP